MTTYKKNRKKRLFSLAQAEASRKKVSEELKNVEVGRRIAVQAKAGLLSSGCRTCLLNALYFPGIA
ncbi:hypothetical protein [Herbaspirillum huttiense]|uniref:hypothetical protein n=1 Tax=Herbaspirillum huttiense TaxID=863372 RepID=UPI0039AFACF5